LNFLVNRIGINARVFNSNPTHEMNMEWDEITKILVTILQDIRKREGEKHIREEV